MAKKPEAPCLAVFLEETFDLALLTGVC